MKRHCYCSRSLVSAVACAALLFLMADRASAALQNPLAGTHVPAAVRNLAPIARANASDHLYLAISLPMRDSQAWNAFLQDLYDPASPNYRHFLTPAQVTDRFGPTAADYLAVVNFAKAQGLTVEGTHPNRLIVDVSGTVATVERVFHTTIQVYQHPTENRTFYAPTSEPSLDLATPILHVTGLDNYFIPKPMFHQSSGSANGAAPRFGSGPDGNYFGGDFRAAYVPGVLPRGEGQSVALVEFDGYFSSDIAAYEAQAAMTNITLTNVLIDGFNGIPYSGGQTEVTLDIDMAVAMAPGLSQVLVYESTNGFVSATLDQLNRIADDNAARQISCSWGLEDNPAYNPIYQEYAAQGQSFFQSAGDNGAFVPFTNAFDSDNPYITLVGGTTLFTSGPGGSYVSESVWNWNSTGEGTDAGGGGFSTNFALPIWQEGFANSNNMGSTQFRNCPDVAFTADNIYLITQQGTPTPGIGGTSAAAPLWAAYMSLVNEQGLENGLPPIGFPNPLLYSLGKSALYESLFHDITVGNNTNIGGGPIDYPAVKGYDLASGLGTPTVALINTLAPPSGPILRPIKNVLSGGNGNGRVDPNECNNLLVTITNAGPVRATGVEGVLVSDEYPGISIGQSVAPFPDVPPFSSVTASVPFTVSSSPDFACGSPVQLALTLKCDQDTAVATITLSSGTQGTPVTFSATPVPPVAVPINDTGASSTLNVSEVQSIADLTVSVFVSAESDAGLTLDLVSPNGTVVTLASGDGGVGANFGGGCSPGETTTFNDAAGLPLSQGSAPFFGSFVPDQPLSAFKFMQGTNANGTWTLHVTDAFPGDTAQINCWSMSVTPFVCETGTGSCPGADLSITLTANPNPVIVGSNFVCALVASNSGPSAASDVVVQQTFQPGTGFVAATNVSQGFVSGSSVGSTWGIGSLPVGGTATAYIVALGSIPDTISTVTASINSDADDANLNNNTASVGVAVELPGADLGVTMISAPNPALENGRVTYIISVTNNGPFTAQAVVLTTLIPNVNFVSASTSQGTVSSGGAQINLGDIPNGSGASVVIVASPTTTGNIIATTTVSLSPNQIDPIQGNNTASVTTTVNSSADLGVTASVSPSPSIAGSNIIYVSTFTNRGPATASDVILTHLFPVGSQLVSTSASGPEVETNANSLVFNIGVLSNGFGGTITTILVAPTNVGPGIPPLSSTFSISGQPADPNTNDNIVVLTTVNSNAFLKVVAAGATLLHGNAITPGTTVSMAFALQNAGNIPTKNLTATLLSSNGVSSPIPSGPAVYGANGVVVPGATVTNTFTFTANGTPGGSLIAQLNLQDGSTSLGVVSFAFTLPVVSTFWNTNFISIPDQRFIPNPDSGPANPYPSTLAVSDISGLVAQVTVTLSNMSHTFPHDVSMLLVSPTGLQSVLMSSAAFDSAMTNVSFTFTPDPDAPVLPANGAIVPGLYQPASYAGSNYFPAPAPAGPYQADLGIFAGPGSNLNGQWSLYVVDETNGDSGSIAQGWALSVETIVPINQVADLGVAVTESANQLPLDGNDILAITVTNAGPNATSATLVNTLPSGLAFVAAGRPPGSFVANGQTITYNLGVIQPGTEMTFTNTVVATGVGLQAVSFVVASSNPTVFDPDAANNTAGVSTTVVAPTADIAALATPPIAPVVLGRNEIYTLSVSNAGPQVAKSATGLFNLHGLAFVSANASQGQFTVSQGSVLCSFGDVAASNIATIQITAAPLTNGLLTNVWLVASGSTDPAPGNNTNFAIVTVLNPAPIIAAGPTILLTPGSNSTISANETVTVSLVLSNIGYSSTTNLTASLQAANGITPVTTSQNYGAVGAGSSSARPFTFVASGLPGATVTATLSLVDGSNSYPAVSYAFTLPNSVGYSNSGAILIPSFGAASPYPSSILVSTNGVVSKVTVTLRGFTHSFPRDVNVLLASPAGQTALLQAHTGGPYSVTNLTFTFDDSATASLPETALSSGTFLGTAYAPIDTLPGFTTPTYDTSLGVFDGFSPNGLWSLYVDDDSQGNSGVISQGWGLNLALISPLATLSIPSQWQAAVAGSTIQLTLTGAPNQTYVVQISADLASWTSVSTNLTDSNGSFTVTDNSTNAPRRYYRALQSLP